MVKLSQPNSLWQRGSTLREMSYTLFHEIYLYLFIRTKAFTCKDVTWINKIVLSPRVHFNLGAMISLINIQLLTRQPFYPIMNYLVQSLPRKMASWSAEFIGFQLWSRQREKLSQTGVWGVGVIGAFITHHYSLIPIRKATTQTSSCILSR